MGHTRQDNVTVEIGTRTKKNTAMPQPEVSQTSSEQSKLGIPFLFGPGSFGAQYAKFEIFQKYIFNSIISNTRFDILECETLLRRYFSKAKVAWGQPHPFSFIGGIDP